MTHIWFEFLIYPYFSDISLQILYNRRKLSTGRC